MSRSLRRWQSRNRRALDGIEVAYQLASSTMPRRGPVAEQIKQAYVVLLSSWFQAFCRDLHTECIEHLTATISHPAVRMIVRQRMMEARKLETGNPNPGNLGADFGRLGIELWPVLLARDHQARARQEALGKLNRWRNAVAHQDFSSAFLQGRKRVRLREVREWRQVCESLAVDFERVMYDHLLSATGTRPW
ncbi:MAG TPA: hypothetical protein VGC13_14300 [Longimicrobium sp.]|uniref:hypothetical protein n=1 Tax=Longimicrobium sp. TaxID=2029185 RepID=UPI002EDAA6A4